MLECHVCGITETIFGQPFKLIAPHVLRLHGLSYTDYLGRYPNQKTFSEELSMVRSEVARDSLDPNHIEGMREQSKAWKEEILDVFRDEGYLSTSDLAMLLNVTRQGILAAVSREQLTPDICGTVPSKDPRRTGYNFYLFSVPEVLRFQRQRLGV